MILPSPSYRDEHVDESEQKVVSNQPVMADPHQKRLPAPTPETDAEPDEQGDDVRAWLVESVREQIKDGSYDEDAKLDAILDRLAEDLGVELKDGQEAHHVAHP